MLISDYLSFNIIICILFLIWPIFKSYGRNTKIFSLDFWFKWKLQNLLSRLTDNQRNFRETNSYIQESWKHVMSLTFSIFAIFFLVFIFILFLIIVIFLVFSILYGKKIKLIINLSKGSFTAHCYFTKLNLKKWGFSKFAFQSF